MAAKASANYQEITLITKGIIPLSAFLVFFAATLWLLIGSGVDIAMWSTKRRYNLYRSLKRRVLQALEQLSQDRAEAVRNAIVEYANAKGYRLDDSQIQPAGVGAREPVVAKPGTREDAYQNMRVEFRLMRVPVETISAGDFDF